MDVKTHPDPVWRDRADFILRVRVPGEPETYEQLWTRQVAPGEYELCCVPFFLYDVSLGDVVRKTAGDGFEVVRPGGRWTFRVWFGATAYPREDVATDLAALGAVLEWSSANLLAVDAADAALAQRVADHLWEAEQAGRLVYETGRR